MYKNSANDNTLYYQTDNNNNVHRTLKTSLNKTTARHDNTDYSDKYLHKPL